MRYFLAHAMIDEEAAKKHFAGYKWIPGLKAPRLAVRFGAGVHYVASRGFSGDPKPVGTTQKLPEKRSRRSRGGDFPGGGDPGGFDGPGGGGLDGPGGQGFGGQGGQGGSSLAKYTGEVGTKIVERVSERVKRGDFGQLLKASTPGAGNRGGGYGDPGGGVGLGAPGGGAGLGAPGGNSGKRDQRSLLGAGLTDVGLGTSSDLLKRAEEEDLDILFVFSVTTSKAKTGLTINNTVVELYDVNTRKKLRSNDRVAPKITLNNIKVQMDRKKGVRDGRDPVDVAINKIFSFLDENHKGESMPVLKPEHAAQRVEALLKETKKNPLPALAEIKYYYMRQWIQPADYGKAATALLGRDEAISMAKGTLAERTAVFADWLPKSPPSRGQGNFAQGGGGFPGAPGGGGFPGDPGAGGFPGAPGADPGGGFPGAPGADPGGGFPGAPGADPGGGFPGAPGADPGGGFPGAPGADPGAPGADPGGGFPGAPGADPGAPGADPGAPRN